MKIIVGLGNPGEKYKNTRHNVGFMVLEDLGRILRVPAFGFEKRFQSEVIGSRIDEETILLVKPQTFMNKSGEAVRALLRMYKDRVDFSDLWVVYDDIDLPLGRIKIQKGGGSAGHHGIESIFQAIGSPDFIRFRMGVGPLAGEGEEYVLQPFSSQDYLLLHETICRMTEAILLSYKQGVEKAMNLYNVTSQQDTSDK